MTEERNPQDHARELAIAEALPCLSRWQCPCDIKNLGKHNDGCPAFYRPAVRVLINHLETRAIDAEKGQQVWHDIAESRDRDLATLRAPQLAGAVPQEERELLYRCIKELDYVQSAEHISQCASAEGKELIALGMKLLGVQDLSQESLIEKRGK